MHPLVDYESIFREIKDKTHRDIPGSEEELSVEIGLLDMVHVGHNDLALWTRRHAHHCPVLEHLTPNCSSTNLLQ